MVKAMKRSLSNLVTAPFSTENMPKSFYLLALVPFILMYYFYLQSSFGGLVIPFGLVIPLYGFIILVLKKHRLFSYPKAGVFQKLFGLIVVFASFFAYFIVSPFFPNATFYGFANYSLYIIGLFLVFFQIRALKEAFTPLFLVLAFLTGSFVSDMAKSFFSPFIPHLTSFIANILSMLGIAVTYSPSKPNLIVLNTMMGSIPLMIGWACVGFTSMYIFSIILVVIMSEDPSSTKTKVIWSIIGVLGTFFIGIIRLVTIFVGFYFYGYEYGEIVHSFIGYILFITWSVIFLYLFSKRNTILQKIRTIYLLSTKS